MVEGWAVIAGEKIDVRTVSPTKRAAKVNGIVLAGIMVGQRATDGQINHMFKALSRQIGIKLVRVEIKVKEID